MAVGQVFGSSQGHTDRQQTCLAHRARDVAYALEVGDNPLALRLKLWLDAALALARSVTTLAASTVEARRRKLDRSLDDILAAPVICDLARDIQSRMRRPSTRHSTLLQRAKPLAPSARDQPLTFASLPGRVEATNHTCERDLRPAVIQRKDTNGYRAMGSATGEAAVRPVVATARLTSGARTFGTLLATIGP